jgi:hypothetical protein
MYEQTIICLANSRKPPSGRCIAGKVVDGGGVQQWVRPVSARPSHEVSEAERRYRDGTLAKVLDIITVPLVEHQPFGFQFENYVLDADYYWEKAGTASWADVLRAVDQFDAQFWSHSQSTYHGTNDKVAEADVAGFGSSLKLVHVHDLQITVELEDGYQGRPGKRKVRGRFTYRGRNYLLSVSDAVVEDEYLRRPDGQYAVGEAVLCISLVEVFHGFSFRVIASVITQQRCEAVNA